jgi:hypothetical protein
MPQQPLGYTNYDFNALTTSLEQRLAAAPNSAWKDMYESGTGQMLIELFAAIGTLVLYYIERRAEESYIQTAQNISSVINLVRLIGYTPRRAVSSTGSLTFTIAAPHVNDITIPKYTSLSSTNGYNFLTANEVTFHYPSVTATIGGIQGILKTVSYTSAGGVNQTYNINDTAIENSNVSVLIAANLSLADATNMVNYFNLNELNAYMLAISPTTYNVYNYPTKHPVTLVVKVNGIEWIQVNSFANSVNTSTHYILRTELNQSVTIVFGDGSFGKQPNTGDIITVTYIESAGIAGNVYSTGLITTINDTIKDTPDQNIVAVTVTNDTTFLGGDDAEGINDIKSHAPDVFATGQRAVTRNDFKAILKNYPGVADAIVFGENEYPNPDWTMMNQVNICAILQDWIAPDANFQTILTNYLYSQALITVRYSYLAPTIIDVVPTLKVKLVPGASETYVKSLIKTAMDTQFILGSTTLLGQAKYESDIVRVIEETIGVDHCHVILKVKKALALNYHSSYTYATAMELLPVKTGTVELWMIDGITGDLIQLGVDNGAGGWTALDAYSLTGLVSYLSTDPTPGLVGVNVSPALSVGSSVYIYYQQDQDGDLILSNQQICKNLPIVYTSIS